MNQADRIELAEWGYIDRRSRETIEAEEKGHRKPLLVVE